MGLFFMIFNLIFLLKVVYVKKYHLKGVKMKQRETIKPNFILYDMGVQSAFAQWCQNFQKPSPPSENNPQDWLIIDNDTGEIITSDISKAPHTSK